MYGCESWTIKKAEHRRIYAFELWCWRRLLRVPLDCKQIKSVNPKGNQSWIFIGRTEAEAEAPLLWPPDVKNRLIGKGNGNPLQCSCLENPRDGGSWWAAVSGVAQSQTRLKRLRSYFMAILFSPNYYSIFQFHLFNNVISLMTWNVPLLHPNLNLFFGCFCIFVSLGFL